MPTGSSPPPSPSSQFETLLTDLLLARDAGDVAGAAAILRDHPEHAEPLRRACERLCGIGLLDRDVPEAVFPERLGDFRLLQRIGSGGMGVVFLAEQESLRRKVAVKLVRPELMLSSSARERFQREVETIAQLQHPGIVPVLAVGQHQGVPYFAMDYIAGCSLHEVLLSVRGHSASTLMGSDFARGIGAVRAHADGARWCQGAWWQAAVRALASVAGTVTFVHERGILHRDLKPSNIMVTAQGHCLLLDFGLAHTGGDGRLTHTGAELGSLAYMSPEQVRGEALDERTDVYSLGVTLYQLLTLALPFGQRQAESLRGAILQGRCRSVRELNRAVPRDLELVVAMAMDQDRSQRHASMAALLADLEAVLNHRAIAARPIGVGIRLQRWRQRHPFASGAGVMVLVMLLCLPVVIAWLQHERHVRMQQARVVAEADLGQARAAIELMWRHASDLGDVGDPAASELREQLYGETLAFYRALHLRHPEDAEVVRAVALVYRSRAILALQTGGLDAALAALAAADEQLRADPEPKSPATWRLRARLAKTRASVHLERREWPLAEAALDEMAASLREVFAAVPDDLQARLLLADCLNVRSHVRGNQGRPAEKLALLQQALAERRELVQRSSDPVLQQALAMQCNNLGETLQADPEQQAESLALYREAVAILVALPTQSGVESLLAEARFGLGSGLLAAGDLSAAGAQLELAFAVHEERSRLQPHKLVHQYDLARTCCARTRWFLAMGDQKGARAAVGIAQTAVAASLLAAPDNVFTRALADEVEALRERVTAGREPASVDAAARRR